jgi:uncharacterized protein related to proFAR isomerase
MNSELQKFIQKKAIPSLKEQLLLLQYNLLIVDFMISEQEEKLKELSKTSILKGSEWKKQITEQASERVRVEEDIKNLKKQKEQDLEKISYYEKLIPWLEEKIK